MRWRVLLVLPVCLLLAADKAKEKAPEKGKKSIEGTWNLVSMERNGESRQAPEGTGQLVFAGNKITMKRGDKEQHGTFKVDTSKKPMTIDVTPSEGPEKDKTAHGIYVIKGDELRISIAQPGNDRPKDFNTKGQEKTVLLTLKRAKS